MDGFASKPVDWFALSHEIARVLGLSGDHNGADMPAQERQLLNHHAGVHRWSGKEDVYLEALMHFERQHAGVGRTLAEHAAAGEYRVLRMLSHKLRGVAANLGMELLSDTLAELEGLVDGDSGRVYAGAEQALLATLARATTLLEASLDAMRAKPPSTTGQVPAEAALATIDLQHALRAGKVLREALRLGGLDDAALTNLTSELAGHPLAARLAQVHEALSDFDFDLALQQLDAVLADIGSLAQETTA